MLNKLFSELCNPVKIYLILQIISTLILLLSIEKGNNSDPTKVLILIITNLTLTFIFSWLGNLLCQKGYTNISWFILIFLPIIFTLLSEFIIL